jgi:translation initiation factor IF-2
LNISNEAVIDFLGKRDKTIRNQMSAVSDDLYEAICKEFSDDVSTSGETPQDFRQQIKEKHMLEELRRNKAKQELEERIRFATKLAQERPQRKAQEEEEAERERLEHERKVKELEEKKAKEEARKTADAEEAKKKADEKKKTGERAKTPAADNEELSVVEMISRAKKEIDKERRAVEAQKSKEVKETEEKAPKDEVPVEPKKAKLPRKRDKEQPAIEEILEQELQESVDEDTPVTSTDDGVVAKEEPAGKRRKKKKRKKLKISEAEIQESIRQTLSSMDETKARRRRRKIRDTEEEEVADERLLIRVSEFISASELAEQLDIPPGEVIKVCLSLGLMVSINQRLDMDVIEAVADEFGYEVEKIEDVGSELIDKYTEEDDESVMEPRPPVVTIMGHVDHGKTSLLDYVRKSSITATESGGITQHIGAYEVPINDKTITFLDTPGHEAFTAMRARGAQATDLVVLIVAADDGVQPQTVEAINHALAASVPIVIAINKMDKPGANPDVVKKQLSEKNILVEEWGGKYQSVEISAKTGQGVDKLLEQILLEAEILELKANPNRTASGLIIESELDKGKGAIATVLVQNGTLEVGDLFVAGQVGGKVRAMLDKSARKIKKAPPSMPVQVIGFDGVPQAGDTFVVLGSEKEVREITTKRQQIKREQDFRRRRHISLDEISRQIKYGELKELNIILKADVDGSIEALADSLMKISNEEVSVSVIHKAVGGISESDVLLATASDAIIIGFHVRPTIQARELAKKEEVDIRLYDIIYSAVDDVRLALEGMLEPEITEELTGTIEVRDTFRVPKVGVIAGSYVLSGKISRNDLTKVYRDDKLLHESRISSLKRFKEDVKEVQTGFECGIGLDGFDDIKVGDIIEAFRQVETARKLVS